MAKPAMKMPSDRNFAFTFAVVFALLGGWLWWKGSKYGLPIVGGGAAFGLIGIVIPKILHPLNFVWMKFGMLLNMIVSPIILGVIFFGVFMPVALLFRLIGRDSLNRKFDGKVSSYWFQRTPPGPQGESFPRQF